MLDFAPLKYLCGTAQGVRSTGASCWKLVTVLFVFSFLFFFLFCFRVSWITRQETPRSSFCASCVTSSASSGGCSECWAHSEAWGLIYSLGKPREDGQTDGCGAAHAARLPPSLSPRTHSGGPSDESGHPTLIC